MSLTPEQVAQFETLITALMSPDNTTRNQAEAAYNTAKASPDVLMASLVHCLRRNPNEQVRSLCAVLLRKAVMAGSDATKALAPAVLSLMKTELLACIEAEPQRHIRKKVCDAVGQLGMNLLSVDINGWPELLPFMLAATQSGDVNKHEAALVIFNALGDFIGEKMAPYHSTLLGVFRHSLQADKPIIVRIAALKALASFLQALESASARQPFQELVPLMLQTIAGSLAAGQEEECRSALEIFVEVAESQPKFLKKSVSDCVTGMISIAGNNTLEDATRHLALEFLLTVAENSPTTARKMPGFVASVVPLALGMMLELECDTPEELAEWEEEEEEDEDTEITNYDVGEEALDRISIAIGGKVMVPILFEKVKELLASADWKQRHAALMAISQSGEGCERQMSENLEQIVAMIVGHFRDPHPRVRWAAINTVGQMCTDFGPDLQTELHATVLPALIAAMDDPCKRVVAHGAAAVINFCEHCRKSILATYLPSLLGKLMLLLQGNQRRVCEQAVTAVASVADVAEEDFAPYYASFMPGLKAILQTASGKECRMLRGKAMECISLIGVAVGDATFSADAKEVMELIIKTQQAEALDPDDPQIAFMLQACGRICKCLGAGFSPYLPFVIPPLLKSAQTDPELHVTDADDDDAAEDEEGVESVTVAIRGQGHKRITIRTSALEEKATACGMLRTYAQELGEAFLPHVQECAQVLIPLIRFQYMDDVRTNAMMAMPELLGSTIKAVKAGSPGATPQMANQLLQAMFEPIMEQLKNEPDTETLAVLLESWAEVVQLATESDAAKLTDAQLQTVMAVYKLLIDESLERRAERAKEAQDDDLDEDEAEAWQEALTEEGLVQNIVEAVGSLFKVYKSHVLPLFDQLLLPHFQQLLQPAAVPSDRVASLCVFDDIVEHCSADGGSSRYISQLFPAYTMYARDESTEVRQAAVYGLGVLAEHGGAHFDTTMQQQAAQALMELVSKPDAFEEENASASDNAVSALGKLCKVSEPIAAAALPRWVGCLPLKADKEEARACHTMLVEWVEASNQHVLGAATERLPDIICIFGQVLNTDWIEEALGPRIGALLKQVRNGLPHVLQALPQHAGFAKLTERQRSELERAISG